MTNEEILLIIDRLKYENNDTLQMSWNVLSRSSTPTPLTYLDGWSDALETVRAELEKAYIIDRRN